MLEIFQNENSGLLMQTHLDSMYILMYNQKAKIRDVYEKEKRNRKRNVTEEKLRKRCSREKQRDFVQKYAPQ